MKEWKQSDGRRGKLPGAVVATGAEEVGAVVDPGAEEVGAVVDPGAECSAAVVQAMVVAAAVVLALPAQSPPSKLQASVLHGGSHTAFPSIVRAHPGEHSAEPA
jgi:hypothetical protein